MEMTAAVRDKQDGTTTCIASSSYSTKKEFRDELRANGYAVIGRIFCEQDMNTKRGRAYYCNGIRRPL